MTLHAHTRPRPLGLHPPPYPTSGNVFIAALPSPCPTRTHPPSSHHDMNLTRADHYIARQKLHEHDGPYSREEIQAAKNFLQGWTEDSWAGIRGYRPNSNGEIVLHNYDDGQITSYRHMDSFQPSLYAFAERVLQWSETRNSKL